MSNFWIRDLATDPCRYPSCKKKATKVVMNSANSSCGSFCASHAKQKLRSLESDHKRYEERQAAERSAPVRPSE